MKKFIVETLKATVLMSFVLVGIILFDKDSIEAKAIKIQEKKGNLHKELTRKERDEYMEYLRMLNNDIEYEEPIYKNIIK